MSNNSNLRIWTPVLLGATMALGIFFGTQMSKKNNGVFGFQKSYENAYDQKIQDIINIIDQQYVDSVNKEELLEQTISELLHKLDPHSNYISAKDIQLANEQIQGEFSGVGIRFFVIRDTVCITNVIKDSPSEQAGIKPGDKILKVDNVNIAGVKIKNDDIMSKLKGKKNTQVKVELLRDGKKITKSIVRGTIPIHTVISSYMIDNETGFIKIDQFSLNTDVEFRDAAKALLDKGMKKLILDLRNNPGGSLQAATNISNEFLAANKIIVSTKGLHRKNKNETSKGNGILQKVKVAVLINENSASASEIVAGALQDNDRATILGRRSFGKGLVQEDITLRDHSNIRLTVARYYTPTGRSIQKPYSGDIEEYYHDKADRYDSGELYAPDSSKFVDSLKFTTPKGKVVYGGGGIMPDVFIPLDTIGNSWSLAQLRYTASFQAFAFDFAHGKYSKWKNPKDFNQSFFVTDVLMDELIKYSQKEYKVKVNSTDLKASKDLIKLYLKAEIARQIWTENGFFIVFNTADKEVKKALEELKK